MPLGLTDNAPLKNHILSNENLSTSHEKLPLKLFAQAAQMTPKTIQTVAFVLGYLPEMEHKSLLLKLPFTLNTGPRESELDLGQSSLRTSFCGTRMC